MIFIRIKVKGYLRNITDNEMFEFEEKGIRNKDKITYSSDGVKNIIRLKDTTVMLIREGNDFVNTFVFDKRHSSCNYLLKENNYSVDIEVNTIIISVSDNGIYIKYVVVDSQCEYEYKIEMSDV